MAKPLKLGLISFFRGDLTENMSQLRVNNRLEKDLIGRIEGMLEGDQVEQGELRSPRTEEVFRRVGYIGPEEVDVSNYVRSRPVAAFNPGAWMNEKRGELQVFPRLVFDYYNYSSSVGLFRLDPEDVLRGDLPEKVSTELVLWPDREWEFQLGCEDPRIGYREEEDELLMLYTASQRYYDMSGELIQKPAQGLAFFTEEMELKSKDRLAIVDDRGSYVPPCKDSAFLDIEGDRAEMLLRPNVAGKEFCWRGTARLDEGEVSLESLRPVLAPAGWEAKIGWSTNGLRLGPDAYLVGWHGVQQEDLAYKEGLALVSGEGDLLAISDYVLEPEGVRENYGDRPFVIFGDGLVRIEDKLLWVGGVSDYCIGFFLAELKDVLEVLHWKERPEQIELTDF